MDYMTQDVSGPEKRRKLSLDAFTLKIIAITSMAVHHTLMVLWEIIPMSVHIPLGFTRGITFPIMAFFVVEGFRRTSRISRYFFRLIIFALIAQIPYMIAFEIVQLNIIFTIALGLFCLFLFDKLFVKKDIGMKILFVLIFLFFLVTSNFYLEGGFATLLMIFLFHIIKNEMSRRTIPLILWGGLMAFGYILTRAALTIDGVTEELFMLPQKSGILGYEFMMMTQTIVVPIGAFLIIPLLRAYNGKLGRRAKYLFYSFYPLHFVVLILIALALGVITGTSLPAMPIQ